MRKTESTGQDRVDRAKQCNQTRDREDKGNLTYLNLLLNEITSERSEDKLPRPLLKVVPHLMTQKGFYFTTNLSTMEKSILIGSLRGLTFPILKASFVVFHLH